MPRPARLAFILPTRLQSADAKRALLLGLFAIARGYLEAAVVVYLRQIHFPQGFAFPLHGSMFDSRLHVEVGREAATIIMLAVAAVLAGRRRRERFAWFLFVFGAWDIVYYLGLKALLNWPASLLTWDVLFLIPFPWAAPVLAPVLVALTMSVMGLMLVRAGRSENAFHIGRADWLAAVAGTLAILGSFLSSYSAVVLGNLSRQYELSAAAGSLVPERYPWWLLAVGLALVWLAVLRVVRRTRSSEAPKLTRNGAVPGYAVRVLQNDLGEAKLQSADEEGE
jgi:hypothetical protein